MGRNIGENTLLIHWHRCGAINPNHLPLGRMSQRRDHEHYKRLFLAKQCSGPIDLASYEPKGHVILGCVNICKMHFHNLTFKKKNIKVNRNSEYHNPN